MTWKEKLYTFTERRDLSSEVFQNAVLFPELIGKHLKPLLEQNHYDEKKIIVFEEATHVFLRVCYRSQSTKRELSLAICAEEAYPGIGVTLKKDFTKEDGRYLVVTKFLIPKSNGKISYKDFNLGHYSGDLEDKIRQFSEFLQNQFRIRGSHFIAGTGWSDNYGISW